MTDKSDNLRSQVWEGKHGFEGKYFFQILYKIKHCYDYFGHDNHVVKIWYVTASAIAGNVPNKHEHYVSLHFQIKKGGETCLI